MTLIKMALTGVIGVLLAVKLKSLHASLGIYLSVAISLLILFFALDQVGFVIEFIQKISSFISLDDMYISILFKLIGVAYLCEFASSICKEAGFQTVGTQIEIGGKLSMIVISMPIIFAVIDTINGLMTP